MSNERFCAYQAPLSLEEISTAINVLNRFYDYAPHSWGEIEQTVNALDEYR